MALADFDSIRKKTLAVLVIAVVVSSRSAAPSDEQIVRYTVRRGDIAAAAELAWWQDYRLYAAILVALTFALVTVHW